MSKYLRIGNGDYNIVTKEGCEITLDTTDGLLNGSGKVIVTGDLEVKGDTQTINSTVVEVISVFSTNTLFIVETIIEIKICKEYTFYFV